MSGVAITRSKSIWPPWIGLHQILCADHVGARRLGLVGLRALREHRDADGFAGAVGEVDDAADHLVGVARVDAEVERDLDRLVELGGRVAFHQLKRLIDAVELLAVDRGERLLALGKLRHRLSPPPR